MTNRFTRAVARTPHPPAPAKLHTLRRADKVQRAATVVADKLDPATFIFPMISIAGLVIGEVAIFIASGVLGFALIMRAVKLDLDNEESELRAAAHRCVNCLKDISEAVLLKVEHTGRTKNGITPERATRELDRRDPRHP